MGFRDCVESALFDPPTLVAVLEPLGVTTPPDFEMAGVRESEGEGVVLLDSAGVKEDRGDTEVNEEPDGS